MLQKLHAVPIDDKSRYAERSSFLQQLGESGLEPGVPPIGLEDEYRAGHQAYKNARAAEIRHDEIAAAIWPQGAIGWTSLIGSYFLTACLVAYLATYGLPGQRLERAAGEQALP
ncbi:MAG: hypothetical protein WCL32_13220, partial [Planctomycetota bacterium]